MSIFKFKRNFSVYFSNTVNSTFSYNRVISKDIQLVNKFSFSE
ncbi:hypothetical protein B4102_3968 [Heyndrickxia sporothermodurans]|uniref:Uncharacterized protein n=1 Tax=Heyndrickxia sporothermodurans TaxID=46224 RepID=A0A150KL08_9BACI|nr:hypothetical protein B4102_3968 [Heyndrickxia sporothermodurans]